MNNMTELLLRRRQMIGGSSLIPYIRNVGDGSYIDTGITANNNTRVTIWARNFNPTGYPNPLLFGVRESTTTNSFAGWIGSRVSIHELAFQYGSSNGYYSSDITNLQTKFSSYHKYDYTPSGLYVDDVLTVSVNNASFSTTNTMTLFSFKNAGNVVCSTNYIDICAVKIYNGDTLVRDLTPVSSPSVGFYDSVTNTVLTNAGTGNLAYGQFDPNAYIPLEYIYNTGQQYIDTGIYGNKDLPVAIDYRITSTGVSHPSVFGTYCQNTAGTYFLIQHANATDVNRYANFYVNVNTANQIYNNTSSRLTNQRVCGVKDSTKVFFIRNAAVFGSEKTYNTGTFTTPYSLIIGALNKDGVISSRMTGKHYHASFGKYGNYVPAKVGGVAGFYETYTDTFHPSESSVNFLPGPVVGGTKPYDAEVEYIKTDSSLLPSTGNGGGVQWIDTGIFPTPNTNIEVMFRFENTAVQRGIFGCSGDLYYSAYINGNSKLATSFSDNSGDWVTTNVAPSTSLDQTIIMYSGNLTVSVDGTVKTTRTVTPTNTASTQIRLFSGHTTAMQFSGRMYHFKVWENSSSPTMFLIPVRVGQVGYMYDIVTGQLFGNEGTGDFIPGPDVT